MQSPVKIVLRLEQSTDEYLDVAEAFAKQPTIVREALLDAIRLVQIQSIDITFLQIENVFRSALKEPWNEPKGLEPILEACRQDKVESRTEKLFYEHGKEYGVAALCLATASNDHRLLREIDSLQDEEIIRLVKNVQKVKKKAALVEFIDEFLQTPKGIVFNPPHRLPRPRTRRKEVMPIEDSRSLSPKAAGNAMSEVRPSNKRRRLYHDQTAPIHSSQASDQDSLRLPSLREAGLAAPYHMFPNIMTSSQLPPPQQGYHPISHYMSQPTTPNPNTTGGQT